MNDTAEYTDNDFKEDNSDGYYDLPEWDDYEGATCWVCDGHHEGRGCPIDARDDGHYDW